MRQVVYLIEGGGLFKIGTSNDVVGRFRTFQAGSPVELSLLGVMDGALFQEGQLHKEFEHRRRHGEWFALSEDEVSLLRLRLRPVSGFDVSDARLPAPVPVFDDDEPMLTLD